MDQKSKLVRLVLSGVLSYIGAQEVVDGQPPFNRHRVDRGTASQSAHSVYRCFDHNSECRAGRLSRRNRNSLAC